MPRLSVHLEEVDKVSSVMSSPEDLRALEGQAASLKEKVTDCDADACLSFVLDGTRMHEVMRTRDGIYQCGCLCRQFRSLRVMCKHTLAVAEKHGHLAYFLNGVKRRLSNETFSNVVAEGFDRQSGSKPQTAGRRGRLVSAGPRKAPTQLQTRGTSALAAMPQRTLTNTAGNFVNVSSSHYISSNECYEANESVISVIKR